MGPTAAPWLVRHARMIVGAMTALPATVPCPICTKPVPTADGARPPCFPFCCDRCRLIDLGRWADGRYVVSDPLPADPDDA